MKLLSRGPLFFSTLLAASANAWSCAPDGSRYGIVLRQVPASRSLFAETFPPELQTMRRHRQEFLNRAMKRISQPYSITETETEIQISIDMPGVKAEDVHVTFEDDGKILTVTGQRDQKTTTTTTSSSSNSEFLQKFTLNPSVDIDHLKANLQNGVLVISAPKDLQRLEKNIRRIPITTDINILETPPITTEGKADDEKNVVDDSAAA